MSTFSAQTFSRQFSRKYQQDPTDYVQEEDEDLPDDIDTSFASTLSLNSPSRDCHHFGAQIVNASFPQSSPHAMDICAPTPLDRRHANNSCEFSRDGANDHENPLFPSYPSPLFHKLSFPPSNLTSSVVTLGGGRQSTAKGCSKARSVLWTHTSNQSTKLHAAVSDIPSFMVSLRPRSVSNLTDYQATASKPENTGFRCGYDGLGFSLSPPIDHLVPDRRRCPSTTT
jgi:hypothetical protein